jgi:hypothetical protein
MPTRSLRQSDFRIEPDKVPLSVFSTGWRLMGSDRYAD